MTIGKFKNLEKGCLVSYKLPGKTKAYGEFVEQVLEDGKKFYMCESLNGSNI
jgi:predicted peroxiredoxin